MKIGELAKATEVSAHTLRYYEKQGLIDAPGRGVSGYRDYRSSDVERIRFIRGAQSLGFSLAEIRKIIPRISSGAFGRIEIERHLQAKIREIDEHVGRLTALKSELLKVFASLSCAPGAPVAIRHATPRKVRVGMRPGKSAGRLR